MRAWPFGQRFTRFGKKDVGRKFAERHARSDVSRFIEDRRPQPAISKSAAQSWRILVAFDSVGQPLRGHGLANGLFNFDQDKPPIAAVRLVQVQDGMARGSAAGE